MKKFFLSLVSLFVFSSCLMDEGDSHIPSNENNLTVSSDLDGVIEKMEAYVMSSKSGSNLAYGALSSAIPFVTDLEEGKREIVEKMLSKSKYNSQEAINEMYEKGYIVSREEVSLLLDFSESLSLGFDFSESLSLGFDLLGTIDTYEGKFIKAGLYEKYQSFFIAIKMLNKSYPQILNSNFTLTSKGVKRPGSFLSSCAGASVGLALSFVGLVGSSATVVGAGIGAAGFVYASANWGNACLRSKKR